MKTEVNYMEISKDQFGRNFVTSWPQEHCYTILTKMPTSKRGEYSEEIDVLAGTVGQAKRIAKIILESDYIPELRISKVLKHW